MPKRADIKTSEEIPPPLRGRLGGGARERAHLHHAQERQVLTYAKSMRREATDAEKKLWSRLRSKQLGGFKFRRQYPVDCFIADFVCLEQRLIVELDGGQHSEAETYDGKRTAYLEAHGFCVLRFWNHDALANIESVLEVILAQLTAPPAVQAPPTPPSPARGEGSSNLLPREGGGGLQTPNPEFSHA